MKQLDQSSDVLVVEDEVVAGLLLDGAQQKLLQPFIAREATIGQAAKELDVSTSMLFHRVKRWLDMGIIKVTRVEPRSGRALKFYKSTKGVFFVPIEMTRSGLLDDVLRDTRRYYDQLLTCNVAAAMAKQEGLGIIVSRGENGVVETQISLGPGAEMPAETPEVFDFFMPALKLDPQDADAMKVEMMELLQRYSQKVGQDDYMLHLGFAPLKVKSPS